MAKLNLTKNFTKQPAIQKLVFTCGPKAVWVLLQIAEHICDGVYINCRLLDTDFAVDRPMEFLRIVTDKGKKNKPLLELQDDVFVGTSLGRHTKKIINDPLPDRYDLAIIKDPEKFGHMITVLRKSFPTIMQMGLPDIEKVREQFIAGHEKYNYTDFAKAFTNWLIRHGHK